jgi:hypothetical protein
MSEKTAEQKLAEALAELAQVKAENAEQNKVIADQHEQIKAAESIAEFGGLVVMLDKAQYKVIAPKFSYEGTEYKAEDLKENKDLLKELVKIGAGILVKL